MQHDGSDIREIFHISRIALEHINSITSRGLLYLVPFATPYAYSCQHMGFKYNATDNCVFILVLVFCSHRFLWHGFQLGGSDFHPRPLKKFKNHSITRQGTVITHYKVTARHIQELQVYKYEVSLANHYYQNLEALVETI